MTRHNPELINNRHIYTDKEKITDKRLKNAKKNKET